MSAIEFGNPAAPPLCLSVAGLIVNSVTERKEALQAWEVQVASEVKAARGSDPWNPGHDYAITLSLRFHPANHGNRSLDMENFVKPILDALAGGLFCDTQTDPRNIVLWNYDDSNFNTLLIRRLADAVIPGSEAVYVCVSWKR